MLTIIAYAISNYVMVMSAAPVASSGDSASLFESSSSSANPLTMIVNVILFLFGAAAVILVIPVSIGLSVRRWHDVNATGWLAVLTLLPTVGSIVSIVQLFLPGTDGPNQYGDGQRSSRNFSDILFGGKLGDAFRTGGQSTTPVSPVATTPQPAPQTQDEQKPPTQPPQSPIA